MDNLRCSHYTFKDVSTLHKHSLSKIVSNLLLKALAKKN
jgi:hypothetical protein